MTSYSPAGGHWYIPGRTSEVIGDFLMNEAEFYAIARLISLVSMMEQILGENGIRFAVACLNRKDAETVAVLLAAIQSAAYYDKVAAG